MSWRRAALIAAATMYMACAGDDDVPAPGPGTEPEASQVAWTVRRLTKEQYAYTVKDVLGIELGQAIDVLPNEARTEGFSNSAVGLVVTSDHIDGYFELSELIGESVDADELAASYADCQTLGDDSCEQGFVAQLGAKMFRRPLETFEVTSFAQLFDAAAAEGMGFSDGAVLVMQGMLQAPQFLYLLEDERQHDNGLRQVGAYEMASRLSYLIWQSSPDDALYAAAADGTLDSAEGVLAQADRMLAHNLGARAPERFVRDWLALDGLVGTEREGLTQDMAGMLLEGAVATYQAHIDEGQPLASVLTSEVAYLPGFAAEWYGLTPKGDGVERYDTSSVDERIGLLTHPGPITTISDRDIGGMVARGLFVMEHMLCEHPLSPPANLNLSDFTSHLGPEATERDYAEDRLANDSCSVCHRQFDPLAFAFERFDGIGQYALQDENGSELRADGSYAFQDLELSFETTEQYVTQLAALDHVQRCVTKKHLMFALGVRGDELGSVIDEVHAAFQANGGTYEALIMAIVAHDVFRTALVDSEQGETP